MSAILRPMPMTGFHSSPSRPPARFRTPPRSGGRFAGILVLSLWIAGCYSFSGSNLPGHIKSVAVPTVKNSTLEPGVEQEITQGVVDRFLSDGRLKIGSQKAAEAILIGELVGYENKVNNYTASQEPIDYIVVLTLSAQMRDQVKNRDLWKEDRLVATAVYEPGAGETEEAAREKAIRTLAGDIVGKTLEQW